MPTTAAGTYEDPIILGTPRGPIALHVSASPQRPTIEHRGGPRFEPGEAPYLSASVRSPQPSDAIAPRGYIDGRQAFVPLTINGIPYRIDGYYRSADNGATWTEDRAGGYYTRVKRLVWAAWNAETLVNDAAVVTWGDDEPTDAARKVAYQELSPAIVGALSSGNLAPQFVRARSDALTAYALALSTFEREASEAVAEARSALANLTAEWLGVPIA